MTQEITVEKEQLLLLPERAIWWAKEKALIVADIHWGKSGHFRKNGIPMPGATQAADAQRLADIVRKHQAEKLIVAGDFFHSRYNQEVEEFTYWRSRHQSLHIDFIIGNHDILAEQHYAKWGLTLHKNGLSAAPFFIAHDDEALPGHYTIHGHLHPGLRIPGAGSYPCFCYNGRRLILPAFSQFTGCAIINPQDFSGVHVVGDGKVMKLK